jgi:hypothetical protein
MFVGEVLSAFSAGSTAVHIAGRYRKIKCIGKGKAISGSCHGGPQGFDMSKLPHILDNRHTDGSEAVNLTYWLPFIHRIPGTQFC